MEYRKMNERLNGITVTNTLCLGTIVSLTAYQILEKMDDEQIAEMLANDFNAKYILLDADIIKQRSEK